MNSLEILDRLISFDTIPSRSNLVLIDFVDAWFRRHGVEPALIPSEDAEKANLWATIGPARQGGVCLSGHSDVVPADARNWACEPFVLTRKGTRLYGRGTADMKAFLAVVLALLPEMLEEPLSQPIHVAMSYDEETGCRGATRLVPEIETRLPKPSIVVVGEPTGMKVVSAHKGMWQFQTTVTGREAHSSRLDQGVSAVMTGARLISRLADTAESLAAAADPHSAWAPPYTTVHVGTVQGGTAHSIVARECRFAWEIRNLPDDDPERIRDEFEAWYRRDVLPGMHAIDPASGIVTESDFVVPALKETPGSEAERLVRSITGDGETRYVSYGTEAGMYQQAGMSAVLCGPGSIEQAHQPDEYIEVAEIEACERFLRALIARCRA